MSRAFIQVTQSDSATQAPVIAAVRVPPSAWMTSQSTVICRSPRAGRSAIERMLRPVSRWDSHGRPILLAGGGPAARAVEGGARQHAVFGGDPAARLALKPGRQAILQR